MIRATLLALVLPALVEGGFYLIDYNKACADESYYDITSASECEAAAAHVGVGGTLQSVSAGFANSFPTGCFPFNSNFFFHPNGGVSKRSDTQMLCTAGNAASGADLELMLPGGAKADLRAQDGAVYCFLSTANLAVNGRMGHIEFERFHQELNTFYPVDGSFMVSFYAKVDVGHGRTVQISYEPGESMWTGCTVSVLEQGQPGSVTSLTHEGTTWWGFQEANITALLDAKPPKLRIVTSDWSLVVRPMSIRGAGKKKRIDLVITPLRGDPSMAAVAPHGLLGQAWDGDDMAVYGKTDGPLFAEAMTRMSLKGEVEKVKTAANAEGAIEGVESDYLVSDPFSTKFKFNRFGLAFAAPRNVSQLTGLKKKATAHSVGVNMFLADLEA